LTCASQNRRQNPLNKSKSTYTMTRRFPSFYSALALGAIIVSASPFAAQSASNTYEWTFDQANLAPVLGPGVLAYADAATPGLTSFGTTDGIAVPNISGQPATYMHVPAFTDLPNGYLLTLAGSGPNGGGSYINQYTFIVDLLSPSSINWTPIFNTEPQNGNDADFYIAPDGSIGISSIYSPANLIAPGAWNRVAFVADLSANSLTYYLNGVQVATGTGAGGLDGRWSLYSNADPGADLLLFNEGDTSGNYTHELYVAGIAFVDRSLSTTEIANLGEPAAEGIFARRLQIHRDGGSVVLTWRPAPNVLLQKATSLTTPDWQPVPNTLGVNAYTEVSSGNAFYRLVSQ
jgi:Concanavalin A-like lectin/glucanases superfamily